MADARISGSGVISGGQYENIHISGSGKITGNCKAESIHISGSGKAQGTIEVNELKVSGSGSFEQKVIAKEIIASGAIQFREDCEADSISVSGSISCSGTLNADTLDADCGGSKFKEICGDKIKIKSKNNVTVVESIEATSIDLYGVQCEFVSGQDIIIGPKCEVNVVEYSGTLSISSNAMIRKVIKI